MKKTIFLAIAGLFGMFSCTDVLDKTRLDIITDDQVWGDPVFCDKYLLECYGEMGFYNEMQLWGSHDDFGSTNNSMISLGISDEATSAWVPTPKTHWINVSGGVYEWWGYDIVRKLNIFIGKSDELPYTGDQGTTRLAEARFLRAFSYFQMVKRYGGVPLITEVLELTDSEEKLYPFRAKEEEIYQFIVNELNDIIDNDLLPESATGAELGRPTKWAAAALKSRAAMYAASIATWGELVPSGVVGIPTSKASYFWNQSLDASDLILNEGPFILYKDLIPTTNPTPDDYSANYRDIFMKKNNSEVIFAERFDGKSGKGHSWDHWQNPSGYNAWSGGQQNCVYLEFVESYENRDGSTPIIDRAKVAAYHPWSMDELFGKKDPRFKGSIYTQETEWTHAGGTVNLDYHQNIFVNNGWVREGEVEGVPAIGFNQMNYRPTPFGVLKYLDQPNALVPERFYSETDWIVFRLGEIYLNKAEAAFALGDEPTARAAINEIRKRAGMPEYQSAITKEDIHRERKIELAFEGNRYWDLRRWREAETALSKAWHGLIYGLDWDTKKYYLTITENVAGLPAPYFAEMHYYMPIAQWRTAQNDNLEQNPGYN